MERMVTHLNGWRNGRQPHFIRVYLIDWCRDHNIETRTLGLQNMITAGEPGGGDPLIRATIKEAFGCTIRESMGIGDISLSVWAEDADEQGMHFMAREFVHVELIDPTSGQPVPWEDGAEGELVYTASGTRRCRCSASGAEITW